MDTLLAFFNITEWLGQPEAASKHAGSIDHMNEFVHWFMLILFVGWTSFFFVVLFKFNRRNNPKASYSGITSHFTSHLEVLVVVVEVALLIGFAFPLWSRRGGDISPAHHPHRGQGRGGGGQRTGERRVGGEGRCRGAAEH